MMEGVSLLRTKPQCKVCTYLLVHAFASHNFLYLVHVVIISEVFILIKSLTGLSSDNVMTCIKGGLATTEVRNNVMNALIKECPVMVEISYVGA